MASPIQPWHDVVSQKRAKRDELLAPYVIHDIAHRSPRVHQVEGMSRLGPEVDGITDLDSIPALFQKIQRGELTAENVARAYIQRAVVAHQLVSLLYNAFQG